jgi:hypothetical protein
MAAASPFFSKCPKCHRDREQKGYTRFELTLLLKLGTRIEAYCITCNESWVVPMDERADLGRAISASK